MRLLLLGTGSVGTATLEYVGRNYPGDIALAVGLVDDRFVGAARSLGIETLTLEPGADIYSSILATGVALPFDIGLLAWWPRLVTAPVLSLATHGFLNFHPSLLPHNRGKHYNFWAIVEERPFGVTIHFVDNSIDGGDIAFQREIAYDWPDTGGSLYKMAQRQMVDLFVASYPRIRVLDIPRVPQDGTKGSLHYARELEAASIIRLDESYRARDLLNLIRARTFEGYPACRFSDEGVEYEVRLEITRITDGPK
jgi:methionyl-tRNA formyltransferase